MSATPFQEAGLAPLFNAAFMIHNDDPKEVVGICVIWQITDPTGKTATTRMTMDEFLATVRNTVIKSKGTLVVSPSGWVDQMTTANQQIGSGGAAMLPTATRIAQASRITMRVDSVIFDDGELWGLNTGALDQDIAARKKAAVYVAQVARSTQASNGDLRAALDEIAKAPYDPHSDYQAKWASRFASQLLSSGNNVNPGIAFLEGLPTPPAFTAHQ